jgi:hypothetical protein
MDPIVTVSYPPFFIILACYRKPQKNFLLTKVSLISKSKIVLAYCSNCQCFDHAWVHCRQPPRYPWSYQHSCRGGAQYPNSYRGCSCAKNNPPHAAIAVIFQTPANKNKIRKRQRSAKIEKRPLL